MYPINGILKAVTEEINVTETRNVDQCNHLQCRAVSADCYVMTSGTLTSEGY